MILGSVLSVKVQSKKQHFLLGPLFQIFVDDDVALMVDVLVFAVVMVDVLVLVLVLVLEIELALVLVLVLELELELVLEFELVLMLDLSIDDVVVFEDLLVRYT